jgi:hypothetical protein
VSKNNECFEFHISIERYEINNIEDNMATVQEKE